jgi:hypothetical protein
MRDGMEASNLLRFGPGKVVQFYFCHFPVVTTGYTVIRVILISKE